MRSRYSLFFLPLFLVFFEFSLVYSEQSLDQFSVTLETEASYAPVYLAFNQTGSSDSVEFIELETVLRFDLAHGGYIHLVPTNSRLDASVKKLTVDDYSDLKQFRREGIKYVVIVSVDGKVLNIDLIDTKSGLVKSLADVRMQNDLQKNRRLIHQISDSIHHTLFGVQGIATTKVIYTVRKKVPGENKWTSDIYEMDYDGANARQVLFDAGYSVTPQYIPAKQGMRPGSFLFVSYKTGQPKIYLGSLINGHVSRLTLLKGNQLMPTLNLDQDQVAFISDISGNPDVFLLPFSAEKGADGRPRQIFTAKHATQGTPTFSPDGKKVAFVSNKDGSPRIYVIDIPKEGAKLTDVKPSLMTKFRRGCTAPSWSPDGKKIAYCARVDGERQIFVFDLEKNIEIAMTKGYGNKENPTWAPNSLHLMYNCHQGSECELFMVNIHQKKPVKLTGGKGEKRFPHWEPKKML